MNEAIETVKNIVESGLFNQARKTLRVHIPLTLRNRGGRPRILPPKDIEVAMDCGQDARLLRAIAAAQVRQYADQGAGASVSLEADAGIRRIHDNGRTGRTRGDCAVLHDPRTAPDPARAGNRRGDSGRQAERRADAGTGPGAVSS